MAKLSRPLPPELHSEWHKFLPLGDAINILVNVPSNVIVLNNKPRILRNVQRLRTSLNEYFDSLALEYFDPLALEKDDEFMFIHGNNIEWKPQLDKLLRYGAWMTPKRYLRMFKSSRIVGMPENLVEELILHLANSRSTQMMLESVKVNFVQAMLPNFLEQFLKENQYQIGDRFSLDFVELKADDGRILWIFAKNLFDGADGERGYNVKLNAFNKVDKNLFDIRMAVDYSRKFVRELEFTRTNVKCHNFKWFPSSQWHQQKRKSNDNEEDGNGPTCSSKIMKK